MADTNTKPPARLSAVTRRNFENNIDRGGAASVSALRDIQQRLFQAQGIVQCVSEALGRHFGDWPAGVPQFDRALHAADRMLEDIAADLANEEDAARETRRRRNGGDVAPGTRS